MSKKFQPLDYSRGWDDYWRDHPQGYSPQEQMINWSGQLNAMIDFFNDYFDVDLPEYATDVMEGWYFDGRLENIINETLFDSKADKTTLTQIAVNVKTFGAKGDGVTDDTQAIYAALEFLRGKNGTLFFPSGTYIIDFVLKIDFDLKILGQSKDSVIIKLKNESTLFHNPTRNNIDRSTDLDNLYRNYHGMIFVHDVNFSISDITLDGNGMNQNDIVDGVAWNYVFGDQTPPRNYYKYFHGIVCNYQTIHNPKLTIERCEIRNMAWCDVQISAPSGSLFYQMTGVIRDNTFGACSHDQLNINRVDGLDIYNNTFKNPNTHSVHCYVDCKNIVINDNKFFIDNNLYVFKPGETTSNTFIMCGHGDYEDFYVRDISIERNTMHNYHSTRTYTGITLSRNLANITIINNNVYDCFIGISATNRIVAGENTIKGNKVTFTNLGVVIRPYDTDGTLRNIVIPELKPTISKWEITDNSLKSLKVEGISDRSIDLTLYDSPVLPSENELQLIHYDVKNNLVNAPYRVFSPMERITLDMDIDLDGLSGFPIQSNLIRVREIRFNTPITDFAPNSVTYYVVSSADQDRLLFPEEAKGILETHRTEIIDYCYQLYRLQASNETYIRWWNSANTQWNAFQLVTQ